MAITNVTKPATWSRATDTNRMIYKFSSSNYTAVNFQYQFNMKAYYPDNYGSPTDLGTYNIHPATDGTVEFNPATIYNNYLGYDINLAATTLTELTRTAVKFQLYCNEFYGTPPVKIVAGGWYEDGSTNVLMYSYNGAQQPIPYDYTALNSAGNLKWVMSKNSANQGQFLTDVTEYRMDNSDYAFLYALGDTTGRPTRIRYTVKYWAAGAGDPIDSPNAFGTTDPSYQQAVANGDSFVLMDPSGPAVPVGYTLSTATLYDTNVSYTMANSLGYYFPCGPANNQATNWSNYLSSWAYYDVDILSGSTVLNTYPIRFIRTNVCSKYGTPWQLFWLNPHGGFDTFTFDKKKELEYKIKRDTYKKKLAPTFNTYEAGERVFNTDVTEETTLYTRNLTQKESQMIIQLAQSPVVYLLKTYSYGGVNTIYSVPYIVVTDSIVYEQKVNSKEISMSIKIRPANQRLIQRN